MKKKFQHLKKFLQALLIITTLSSFAQVNQEYTIELTTTRSNTSVSKVLIDVPELTDNAGAIIVATLKDNSRVQNPHPMGAWFYQGKWNIFNTDHAPLPLGLTIKVTYFLKPVNYQFVHVVGVIESEGSYINNSNLNNNPNAKFFFFQNHGVYPNGLNPYEAEVIYSTKSGRWYIRNKDGHELTKVASYNIVVSSPGSTLVTTMPVTTTPGNTTPVTTTPVTTTPVTTTPVTTNPTNTNLSSKGGPIVTIYMSVWVNGKKLPGQNIRANYMDQTQILGYDMGVVTARETGSGRSTGRRQHEPFTIKCTMGYPATIMLFDALVNAKPITLTLDFISHDPAGTGVEGLNYSVKLTGALITSFKEIYEELGLFSTTNPANPKKSYNEIKFSYTKIEFISPGAMAEDNN